MRIRRSIIISVVVVLAAGAVGFIVTARTAQRRAQSLNCASSVVSICLAGSLWAQDHGGSFPANFTCMSNELATPKILSCLPTRRTPASDWSVFTPDNCTYEIVSPGVHETATNTVFLRCIIHGHRGYSDMTVFDGLRRRGKFD